MSNILGRRVRTFDIPGFHLLGGQGKALAVNLQETPENIVSCSFSEKLCFFFFSTSAVNTVCIFFSSALFFFEYLFSRLCLLLKI